MQTGLHGSIPGDLEVGEGKMQPPHLKPWRATEDGSNLELKGPFLSRSGHDSHVGVALMMVFLALWARGGKGPPTCLVRVPFSRPHQPPGAREPCQLESGDKPEPVRNAKGLLLCIA